MTFTCKNGLNRRFFVTMLRCDHPPQHNSQKATTYGKRSRPALRGDVSRRGTPKRPPAFIQHDFRPLGSPPDRSVFLDFWGCPVCPCLERRIRLTNRPRRISCSLWGSDATESAARTRGDNVGCDAMNDESRHDGA